MNKTLSLSILAIGLGIGTTGAFGNSFAEVTFANDAGNALADASNNPLAVGDLIEIGSFNISNATIATLAAAPNGEAALLSHFTLYGSGAIGDNITDINRDPLAGFFFSDTTPNTSTNALGINHLPVYLVAFNAATVGAATQQIILTGIVQKLATGWEFPSDTDIPNTDALEADSSALAIVGGRVIMPDAIADEAGYGTCMAFGAADMPIPEPATWASLAGGLALAVAFWARRCSAV
jgi:hypothetical protein